MIINGAVVLGALIAIALIRRALRHTAPPQPASAPATRWQDHFFRRTA